MTWPQGVAQFTGIGGVLSATMTLSHGVSPSTARLVIAPAPDLTAEVGTLTFTYGATTITWHDCKLDRSTLKRGAGGETWEVSILDRRWKWRFGQVSGKYNTHREDASIHQADSETSSLIVDTERTPQELAAIYLAAMGETGYDVAALPNDARPEVEHDHDNPADALAALCDRLGCRIVLALGNRVRIVRAGRGGELPGDFLLENSPTINPPEMPDRIAVVCGPSVYQVDFPLEAVGLDVAIAGGANDTIKPIDDLTYKPAGGWSTIDLPYFYNIAASGPGAYRGGLRSMAVKSVFRYYRIVMPVKVPGYEGTGDGQVARREQLLPIFEEQVRTAVESGDHAPLPAAVFGVWYPGLDDLGNTQPALTPQGDAPPASAPDEALKTPFYLRGFTIDAARGLVIFDEPVYRNATPDAAKVTVAPAQLVLRTKCRVRDVASLAEDRYVRERATGGNLGTPTRYLRHEALVATHLPTYDPAGYANVPTQESGDQRPIATLATNRQAIDAQCDRYLDAALAEYDVSAPWHVKAIGLLPVDLDGAIHQVTWSIGASGATTVVSRNNEGAGFAIGHAQRQHSATLRRAADQAEQARSPEAGRRVRRESAAERRAR